MVMVWDPTYFSYQTSTGCSPTLPGGGTQAIRPEKNRKKQIFAQQEMITPMSLV